MYLNSLCYESDTISISTINSVCDVYSIFLPSFKAIIWPSCTIYFTALYISGSLSSLKFTVMSFDDFVITTIFLPIVSIKYFSEISPSGPFYFLSIKDQFLIVFFLQLYKQSIIANYSSMCYKCTLSSDQQITKSSCFFIVFTMSIEVRFGYF
jgi:hypothetical protein